MCEILHVGQTDMSCLVLQNNRNPACSHTTTALPHAMGWFKNNLPWVSLMLDMPLALSLKLTKNVFHSQK